MSLSEKFELFIINVSGPVPVLLAILVAVVLSQRRISSNKSPLPLPPGPRRLPVIGNLLDVPTQNVEMQLRNMNAQYGDILYLDFFKQPMIVLGTHEASIDLLEKRAANYSDRKFSSMADLTGLTWLMTSVRYGDRWRRMRRVFHQHMNAKAVTRYRTIQECGVKTLLLRLLETPKYFSAHGRFMFGAVIMRLVYGIDVDECDDKYLHTAEEAIAGFSLAFMPGRYLVETFPSMRYIPRWFPGAKFKQEAAEWRPAILSMRNKPYEDAVKAIRGGSVTSSMVSDLKERVDAGENEDIVKDAAASVYLGASDSTLSVMLTFLAAMANYPEVQRRAQAELDSVVGPQRLPTLDDVKLLPYVSALIKESLRWKPVAPTGTAHLSLEEDEYRGYRIPKGSIMVSNVWAYSRDPRHYTDPEVFRPERFLKDGQLDRSVLDPSMFAFGYGRRSCPGKHFAQTTLSMLIPSLLHTFWISTPTDENGNSIPMNLKMTCGVISQPEPFDCDIKPRSAAAENLIRTLMDEQKNAEDVELEV